MQRGREGEREREREREREGEREEVMLISEYTTIAGRRGQRRDQLLLLLLVRIKAKI